VGFENNLLLATKEVAPDNAALVAQLLEKSQRPVASPAQARALMGMR